MKTKSIIVLLVTLLSAASVQARIISVNLAEGSKDAPRENQTVLSTEIAGYGSYARTNWNNLQEDSTGASALIDDTGALTEVVVNFVFSNAWGDGSVDTSTGDGKLARGYFDDGETSAGVGVDIEVTDVPYPLYDVILYMTSDFGTNFGEYNVNGAVQTGAAVPDGDVFEWTEWIMDEYVLVFEDVTGSTLNIHAPIRNEAVRGTIAGFQISEIPEPATLLLLGMGGLALLKKRKA